MNNEPSVEELRRKSEQSRKVLAHTVEDLREKVADTTADIKRRVSPAQVKAEVKGYVRDTGEQWVSSLKNKALDNPLQTVAIGAGLAYPLWGLLRRIPVPIIVIGAGFWLSKQNRSQEVADKAADLLSKATEQALSTVQDAAIEGANQSAQSAADARDAVAAGVKPLIDKAAGVASDARSAATSLGEKLVEDVQNATTMAVGSASEALSTLKDKATRYSKKTSSSLMDVIEKNPLLVAGVGLAIGGFIAASVPSTDTEHELFGKRSDQLKEKAQQAAAGGVERAKDMTAALAGDAVAAAAREGLSSDGLKKA
ncbi:MAG: hypothetical protein ACXWP1_12100, partial [Bdellovibrionota bacterium]